MSNNANSQIFKWKTISSTDILNTPWVKVMEETCQTHKGEIKFFVIREPNWAIVCPVTPSGKIVFIEQYRKGSDSVVLELPGGALDGKDDPQTAALRELEEETGFKAIPDAPVQSLGDLFPEPNRNNNHGFAFLVQVQEEPTLKQDLDDTEQINIVKLSVQDALQATLDGRITHACHVAFLYRAFLKLGLLQIK